MNTYICISCTFTMYTRVYIYIYIYMFSWMWYKNIHIHIFIYNHIYHYFLNPWCCAGTFRFAEVSARQTSSSLYLSKGSRLYLEEKKLLIVKNFSRLVANWSGTVFFVWIEIFVWISFKNYLNIRIYFFVEQSNH